MHFDGQINYQLKHRASIRGSWFVWLGGPKRRNMRLTASAAGTTGVPADLIADLIKI